MAASKTNKISFEEWIDSQGIKPLARKLGVSRFTVLAWKAKRGDPRVDTMRLIKRMTRGRLGYEQMIDRDTPTKGNAEKRMASKGVR